MAAAGGIRSENNCKRVSMLRNDRSQWTESKDEPFSAAKIRSGMSLADRDCRRALCAMAAIVPRIQRTPPLPVLTRLAYTAVPPLAYIFASSATQHPFLDDKVKSMCPLPKRDISSQPIAQEPANHVKCMVVPLLKLSLYQKVSYRRTCRAYSHLQVFQERQALEEPRR